MVVRSVVRSPVRSVVQSVFGESEAFNPFQLFSSGAQGAWYDPSDYSTLYQDAAGTTPVTAVEQPVRLMLDRSGRGNHAVAPNDASRPVLRARYNLLTRTEEFDDAAWVKPGGTLSASAPWTLTEDTTNAQRAFAYASASRPTLIAGSYTAFFDVSISDAVERRVILYNNGTSGSARVLFDLETVSVIAHAATTDRAIIDLGGGIFRLIVTWDATAGTSGPSVYTAPKTETTTNPPLFVGDGAQTLTVYRVSLLTAADHAATGGAYQRVGAATDYDTGPPWRPYLAFDGSDDSFSTSSIDFSGTDEMTVFAGVTKLSDAARGAIVELTASAAANNGAFLLAAPNAASATFAFESKGTALTDAVETSIAAPTTAVLTGIGDISGDVTTLRRNGTQRDSDTGDQGTGNYANAALFIGRRNNTSLPFNGRLYGLTVLGRTATAPELTAMESWIAGKTGVSL